MLAKPEEIPALPGAHETIKMIAGQPWTIGTLLEFEKQRDAEGSKARSSRPQIKVGMAVDAVGVLVIVGGILVATVGTLFFAAPPHLDRFTAYRQNLGRAILLGLELLVAGDIIRTVAVAPTLQNLSVLALIVVIRTFLSFSLELEVTGRWPWQQRSGIKARE